MKHLRKILIYTILIIGAVVVLFPFVWMVLTSLKSLGEVQAVPPVVLPENYLFSNYNEALSRAPFLIYFFNSVVIAFVSTIFVLVINSLGAFAFVKYDFKGKSILLTLFIATMMVPGEMLIITNFQTIAQMQLVDTRVAVFLPYVVSVFYMFLIKQFFEQIPKELYLASKIDGDSDFQFFYRVLLPISKPVLVTVSLLNIIGSWNAFLWPILVTNSQNIRTLPIGLIQFSSDAGSEVQLLMAASTIVILPMIILFIITRKFVIGGLTHGSVKG